MYAATSKAVSLLAAIGDTSARSVFLQGLVASSAAVVFASVARRIDFPLVFILDDADSAGYFFHDLTRLLGREGALFFPSSYRRKIRFGQKDAANEILRTETLARLSEQRKANDEGSLRQGGRVPALPLMIVTYPEALSELVMPCERMDERVVSISEGGECDVTELQKQLDSMGFHEVDYVYEPGQYAVRGSIFDVYSFSYELPFRIDFFGDDVDTIRTFDVQTQLSVERRTTIEIVPQLSSSVGERVPVTNFFPDDTLLVTKDLGYVLDVVSRVSGEGFSAQAIEELQETGGAVCDLDGDRLLVEGAVFERETARFRRAEFGSRPSAMPQVTVRFNISPQPLFHKNFELLTASLDEYASSGYRLFILADSEKQHQRLSEIILSENEKVKKRTEAGRLSSPAVPIFVKGALHEGFIDHDKRALFFTDHQIFDRFHKYSLRSEVARRGKVTLTMKELQEMEPGDFVVHVDLGIGKFAGLMRVPVGDSYQEVIRIIYAHGDKVDVSIHALYKISKYKRGDSETPPRLSTLGTGAWNRLKERAKTRIKDIARDLIKLYAARRHERGFAFSADTYMQHELEASFLYEDTPDQLKATNDVKADMESLRPMDRLVCGDVGFGKTEVAVRAAFKAACDSKQTAVLVPTTVLAYQHYQTFSSRLKNLPVRVEYLTRARSAKQTMEIIDDLAAGRIDIIIGTHKLIGKSVKFKDLGLLIVDEEQKFGVSTKEKLRKMKTNVDTLTMSATPIPRTLQFSLMGARDMSIIRTPPPNRYPICTELHTFSADVIAEAVDFEMARGGQVFFVNNRISNLPAVVELIHRHVPDARVAIGHGQMHPEDLERIVLGFINYEYDVLVSTTIIENGIDIPNANTIIINDAHKFGLSDLHQMRGRVGRSNKKAFCYLLAPPKTVLTTEARRRLEALETFSELGSGFSLSMQDLDIRGAGNLLGAEQSGFMEDLGYETYQKILAQAVTELKNDEFGEMYTDEIRAGRELSGDEFVEDCAVESDLEMYFPERYVPSSSERMLLYRELEHITDDASLERYEANLRDRFGRIPHEGMELLRVVPLRRMGKHLGCEKIMLKQGQMTLYFVSNPDSAYYKSTAFDKVLTYIGSNARRCNIREAKGKRSLVIKCVGSVEEAVALLNEIENPPCVS